MLILSYIFLNKETTFGTVLASISYPIFVRLTSSFDIIEFGNLKIIFIIIAGIICGITCGYIYKIGFSQGGINVLSLIIKKYFRIKISLTNFIMNSIILFFGVFYFGIEKGLYSLIVVVLNSFLINKILSKK